MNPILTFTVEGRAATAGSKKSFRHAKTGKIVTVDTCARKSSMQRASAMTALKAANEQGWKISDKPISLDVIFYFARPANHFRTGKYRAVIKPDHIMPWHAKKPDLDKLYRCIGDALTGVIWKDDSQVSTARMKKVWGPQDKVEVTVREYGVHEDWQV